jgi:hypothetical protein
MAKIKNNLPVDYLMDILDYNPDTGEFYWRYRPDVAKRWNTKFAGKLAGAINLSGYLQISIHRKLYYAHRLAWAITYGLECDLCIDHIDGNKLNNKISNLRLATQQENHRNCKMYNNNTSGVKGVSWHKDAKKWRSWITINKIAIHLGLFDDIHSAAAARKYAEIECFGEFRKDLECIT